MEIVDLPAAPGLKGAIAFVIAFYTVGFPLKAVGHSLYGQPLVQKWIFFALAPFYSPRSWQYCSKLKDGHLKFAIKTTIFWLTIALSVYGVYWYIVNRYSPEGFVRSYMAFPAFYVLTETLGALFRLLFLLSGRLLPPVHNRPLLSHSLSHFWGRCWNRWVGEWLRHLFFYPMMRRPKYGILMAFTVSGIWHELIITLPHYLRGNNVQFGPMALYFLIQGIAMLVEPRRWNPTLKRAYMYTVVIIPAPLVVSPAFLHAFFL
jgi:hypothetical protein